MIENAHKHLERPTGEQAARKLIEAASEVGPPMFFSLLIITVCFLPIFTLEAQEGRLFKPLAYTKTFAMAAAAFLSITVVPALMVLFVRGRIVPGARATRQSLPDLVLSTHHLRVLKARTRHRGRRRRPRRERWPASSWARVHAEPQ